MTFVVVLALCAMMVFRSTRSLAAIVCGGYLLLRLVAGDAQVPIPSPLDIVAAIVIAIKLIEVNGSGRRATAAYRVVASVRSPRYRPWGHRSDN